MAYNRNTSVIWRGYLLQLCFKICFSYCLCSCSCVDFYLF